MQREDWIRHLEALSGCAAHAGPLPPDPTLLTGERGEQRLWRACAGEPISVEDVIASRMIADPLHLLDCSLETWGGFVWIHMDRSAEPLSDLAISSW